MNTIIFVGFFAALLGPQHMQAKSDRILVHGHRGARAVLPENTLPAFKYAIEIGADVLEMDLGVTKDGILVVAHDPYINPVICQYKDGKKISEGTLIYNLTLNEIKKMDCGSLKNPKFPKQKPVPQTEIPTLDEVFDLVEKHPSPNAKKIRFNIETKIEEAKPAETVDAQTFARLLVDKIRSRGLLDRVIIQSFDYRTLREARVLEPKIQISALTEDSKEDLLKTAKDLNTDFVSPYYLFVNPQIVARLHNMGVKIAPWTVNTPTAWNQMIKAGVDAIITDDPENLINFLKAQK